MTNKIIQGVLLDSAGTPIRGAKIRFVSTSTKSVLNSVETEYPVGSDGAYNFSVKFGIYTIQIRRSDEIQFRTVCANAYVFDANTHTLEELIQAQEHIQELSPELIQEMMDILVQTNAAKAAAAASATNAAASATSASGSAVTATTKANAASTSAANAATSATTAATKASEAADSATNASGSASIAATKATAAATSATNAATSTSTASTKATEAATSATNAAGSASTATSKASEASTSATSAATKAGEAATSAATATTKATEAGTSASNAAASATSASGSAVTATTKANAASTSAANAATSATTAATKADEAATSASGAATSATTATTKATEAGTSAANAATSATTATTKATAAATSATNASTSATNAATSATNAATSATTATTKASEASASATTATTKATEAGTSAANAATSATTATTKATEAGTSAANAATSVTTATTKAAAAAASANEAAQSAALAAGALIEAGGVNLSSGVYPTPIKDAQGNNRSCFWKVTVAGTVGSEVFGVGDSLVYSKEIAGYYKIDNTESVTSVNGKQGVVSLVKADVGLSNVDNTSDVNKPVSTAQLSALDLKANLASPALTGTPSAPTAAVGTNTTQVATTAFVNAEIANDSAPKSHVGAIGTAHGVATTSVAGFMSSTDKTKLDGITSGANAYVHPTSGVVAGTYKSVTVDANGHVTAGTNPTTLAGYGITDAAASSHTHSYLPLTGGTLTGDLVFADSGTTKRGIQGTTGVNDQWFIGGGAAATNAGYMEISTGDEGTEPIYVRQYMGQPLSGTGTVARTLTLLDASGNTTIPGTVTAPTFTGTLSGNASTASKWATARTLTLSGDATGSVSIDGSANSTLTVTVADDSHNHVISNVDGLQDALDGKLASTGGTVTGTIAAPTFQTSSSTGTTYVTGGGDAASSTTANLRLCSWYGVGFSPTISGQTIPVGENAVYINVRTGDLTARGRVTAPSIYEGANRVYSAANKPTAADVGALASTANAVSASKWATARTLTFTGGSTGTGSIDGSGDVSIAMTVPPTGHIHALSTISDSPYKEAADVATTAALTVTATATTLTNSGTLAALALDGVTCTAGMRVLVKNQAATAQNGIYTVTNAGSASVAWVLTRSTDADTSAEIAGAVVTVDQGTVNGAGLFTNDFKKTSTLGTTGMLWRTVVDSGNIGALHHVSGATAGTYRSVTVNAQGHVTAGTNPTTLAEYGITDALQNVSATGLDVNAFPSSSLYKLVGSGWANIPSGTAGNGDHVLNAHWDANASTQLYLPYNSNAALAWRRKSGGSYSGWMELYHEGNKPTASDVGLGNVNNTSDLSKPISTATQSALDAKVPTTRTVNGKALTSNISITASDVGAIPVNGNAPTASKLLNAANISVNNVTKAFDGSGNISWGITESPYWTFGGIADSKPGLLLIARKYVGTLKAAEGFFGRVMLTRGGAGSSNFASYADVIIHIAYNANRVELLDKSVYNTDIQIVEVTYNSEVWYAIYSPTASSRVVSTIGNFLSAPILIADASAYSVSNAITTPTNYSSRYKPTASDVGALASDGTAVSANKLATARTLTIGNTGKTFDGTGNVSWTADEMGVFPAMVRSGSLAQDPATWANSLSSGIYTQTYPSASRTVAVFNNSAGSTRTFAISMAYTGHVSFHSNTDANRWLSYDVYTTGNKPTASDVGLGNVNNTSDLSKPISTATQSALDAKVPTTRTVNGKALSSNISITASDVGLGNVPNTVHSSANVANTVAVRDSNGDLSARFLRSEYSDQTTISGALAFRIDNSSQNYIRFCSNKSAIRDWLGTGANLSSGISNGQYTITTGPGLYATSWVYAGESTRRTVLIYWDGAHPAAEATGDTLYKGLSVTITALGAITNFGNSSWTLEDVVKVV